MMAENPNWWNMYPPALLPPQVLANGSSSSSVIPFMNSLPDHHVQDPPQSWSQLLLSGNTALSGDQEDRLLFGHYNHFQPKKLENWEEQMIISSTTTTSTTVNSPPPRFPLHNIVDQVKQETVVNNISQKGNNLYGQADHHDQGPILQQPNINNIANCGNWSQVKVMPAVSSSPRSCITSNLGSNTSNNMLDFSYNKTQTTDHSASSECNSTATGGVCKKARVQSSFSQPPLKVRKEKLGDKITALHQLVSPFGKTDTASVLLEAIGYIRFLQSQIEALSSPYLGHASKNMRNQPYDVEGQEKLKDLRSKGLCLVPVSCTQHVGSDTGADYWAPANYGSGF